MDFFAAGRVYLFRPVGSAVGAHPGYRLGVDDVQQVGVRDDAFDRPQVTPDPTPSDNGLFRMAGVGAAMAAVIAAVAWRWLRANIVITRR